MRPSTAGDPYARFTETGPSAPTRLLNALLTRCNRGMVNTFRTQRAMALGLFVALLALALPLLAAKQVFGQSELFRVLVVLSYSQEFPWSAEEAAGIRETLDPYCDLTFISLDTKKHPQEASSRAAKAYNVFKQLQPHGVIAADDNAQFSFVLPYLKGKTQTPVVFCGVNAKPEEYGYPTETITGVLERIHLRESMAFATQLAPGLQTFCGLTRHSPTGLAVYTEVTDQIDTLPLKNAAFVLPRTLEEAQEHVKQLRGNCDLLFLDTLEGLTDTHNAIHSDTSIIPMLVEMFNGPSIAPSEYAVHLGVLTSVAKSGREQGRLAASMLLDQLHGRTLDAESRIVRNVHGKRIINVTTMRTLGLAPRPAVLRGAQLVKTVSATKP